MTLPPVIEQNKTPTRVTAPAAEPHVVRPRPWLAVGMLCWREMVRFFRQRNRVVGAIGQPLLFWLLFGAGFERSFSVSGGGDSGPSYWAYYFPGTLVLILLFTAIFTTISIIEDRREGFLQSVLVAPIPRWSMVLGKLLGGTLIALIQGLIFLALALTLNIEFNVLNLAALVVLMFVSALALTGLGFVIAWRMESTQGYHAIMMLVLMPMWLLSGAFFPLPAVTADSTWTQLVMHWGMRVNPVTYCVAGVRQTLFTDVPSSAFWMPSLTVCWTVALLFAAVTFAASCLIAGQRTTGDLL
jgi:ABC-2 type transport system permease protein